MHPIAAGFISGALAGVIMGLLSHILFILRIFKSSLILIDGSFLVKSLKLGFGFGFLFCAGLVVHLMTSGIFGALYFIAAALFGVPGTEAMRFGWISVYVALLWLSMLFIALPIAGEGILGRRSGKFSWLEQLLLHIVFYLLYCLFLYAAL